MAMLIKENKGEARIQPVEPKRRQPSHPTAETVAFDTNMLLNIERFNVDIFREARGMIGRVEFVVPAEVVREMDSLAKKGKILGKEVKIAKMSMESNGAKVVDFGQKSGDLALLKMAPKAIIGTNDKELKDSVRELNGRLLILRRRKFLEFD